MSIHHFSNKYERKKYRHWELGLVVMMLMMLYIGGFYLIPSLSETVEQAVLPINERHLQQAATRYVSFEGVTIKESETIKYDLELLLETGYFSLTSLEEQRFRALYSFDSYVLVSREKGHLSYDVFLFPK